MLNVDQHPDQIPVQTQGRGRLGTGSQNPAQVRFDIEGCERLVRRVEVPDGVVLDLGGPLGKRVCLGPEFRLAIDIAGRSVRNDSSWYLSLGGLLTEGGVGG